MGTKIIRMLLLREITAPFSVELGETSARQFLAALEVILSSDNRFEVSGGSGGSEITIKPISYLTAPNPMGPIVKARFRGGNGGMKLFCRSSIPIGSQWFWGTACVGIVLFGIIGIGVIIRHPEAWLKMLAFEAVVAVVGVVYLGILWFLREDMEEETGRIEHQLHRAIKEAGKDADAADGSSS